jgi:hypothetical protein
MTPTSRIAHLGERRVATTDGIALRGMHDGEDRLGVAERGPARRIAGRQAGHGHERQA